MVEPDTVFPRYNATRYNADSVITWQVLDLDFFPPGGEFIYKTR